MQIDNEEFKSSLDFKLIRDFYRHIVESRRHGYLFGSRREWKLTSLPDDRRIFEQYMYSLSLAGSYLMKNCKSKELGVDGPNEDYPMFIVLSNCDLSRVTAPVAIASWLTVDDFRFPANEVPQDLNYGLVMQYPRCVLEYAMFVAGYHTTLTKPIEFDSAHDQYNLVIKKAAEEVLRQMSGIDQQLRDQSLRLTKEKVDAILSSTV